MRTSLLVLISSLLLAACDSSPAGGGGGGAGSSTSPSGSGARFFLPTGGATNTTDPKVVTDARGDMHAVYPRYNQGDAFYAFCGAGCQGVQDASEVVLPTDDTVTGAMVALTSEGQPRVLLSDSHKVYFASCDTGCTSSAGWTVSTVLQHDGNKEVSGSGFALDGGGRPVFILHTRVTYLHVAEKDPQTELAVATGDPHDAAGWTITRVSDQNWYRPTLRFDATGRAHVAAVIEGFKQADGSLSDEASYLTCAGDCSQRDSWAGIGLVEAYTSFNDAVTVRESVSLALTSDGHPRLLAIGRVNDSRTIDYFACDSDCAGDHWKGLAVSSAPQIGDGIELALDANDHPRFAYTLDYNIGIASCDLDHCEQDGAKWGLTIVEGGTQLPPDSISLYENCNVDAWLLHSPSLALTPDGQARVGYVARDASGGWVKSNPNGPDCPSGTDLLWTRMAFVPTVK